MFTFHPHFLVSVQNHINYFLKTLLRFESQTKPHTLIVEYLNIPHSPPGRAVRQQLNREIREQADFLTQMDLNEIYRTFHPNRKENTFFSAPYETLFEIDHIHSNKANLNRDKNKLE